MRLWRCLGFMVSAVASSSRIDSLSRPRRTLFGWMSGWIRACHQ